MQGQVLSYNNAAYQVSMIVSPLIAGAVYTWNHEWVFYLSAIVVTIGGLAMAYVCTWKNVKTIGKTSGVKKELEKNEVEVKVEEKEVKEEKVEENEMKEVKVESEQKEVKVESERKVESGEKAIPDSEDKKEVSVTM